MEKIDQAKEKNKASSPLRRNEKSAEELQEALENEFYIWVKHIEEQKLLYFALTYTGRTLLITAPSDTDEQKRFLGYEFSTRRGKEGIIEAEGYLTNMHDRNDRNKLAWFVKAAFDGIQCESEPYRKYVSYIRTADLLDFSRPSLDLQLKLTADKTIKISSKYPLVKLGDSGAVVVKGQSITSAQTKKGNIKVVAGGIDYAYLHNEANRPANTITISASGANAGFVNLWKEPIFASDCITVRGKNDLHTFFLYNFLLSIQDQIFSLQKGTSQPHVYPGDIKLLQVPDIDTSIQKKIVAECEKVDEEYNTSRMTIEEYKKKIAQVFERLDVITNVGGG